MLGGVAFDFVERGVEVVPDPHDVGSRVGTVLHLGVQFLLHDDGVEAEVRDDDDLARPGREVDRHVATDEQLGGVDRATTRPEDLVDRGDRFGAVGHRGDRLRAADRPDLVDAESAAAAATAAEPFGGVQTTIRSTPATWAGTPDMMSDETSPVGT